ncbi:MAG: DUF4116 domain-containing protein, partial [Endozoicomonas sp. (ex Botrylloides leachii)]|nr:DUF4116 domain-containing protein [Endozoicomonas sp. (ex Botrylloides leachii)]
DDCYTGCTKEKKSSVLKRLSTHAKSLNPNSSVNSSPIDDALLPRHNKQKMESIEQTKHEPDCTPARQQFGGKGMFLQTMQAMNLPVPPFKPINLQLIKSFETVTFKAGLLRPFIPDLPAQPTETSLHDIAKHIGQYRPYDKAKRTQWLLGLTQFISSEAFYQVVQGIPAAKAIESSYQQLITECPNQPVIVRSSGIHEDNYGDAQAGKFDSHVKGAEPILKTCLKVMASGYNPAHCLSGQPQPIAMVLQTCVPCELGGVVLSHASLQDDRIKVEYAPGQPRTAVAGSGELTPHRYLLDRHGKSDNTLWQQGVIKSIYQLQLDDNGAWREQEAPYAQPAEAQANTLPANVQEELISIIRQLEDRLLCPVDVEFALGQNGQIYILQVRPITRLTGGSHFSNPMPSAPLLSGQLVSEGCCSGEPVYVEREMSAEALPKGAIIYANHGADWMLEPDVLNKVGGFVLAMGGTNDHIAITMRQAGKPCLIVGEQLPQLNKSDPVTLVAGSFNGTEGACVVLGNQVSEWLACRTHLHQDYQPACDMSRQYQPVHPSFQKPQEGFAWLSQQNDRLLNYFHTDRLFHQCLSPQQSKVLSMSGNRESITQQLHNEANHFCEQADALLSGYEQFLALAGNTDNALISDYRNELTVFKTKLIELTTVVKKQTAKITSAFQPSTGILETNRYETWLAQCQQLRSILQDLNQPKAASAINSLHDLIFFIHRRFVDGLPVVAEQSGQGRTVGFEHRDLSSIEGKWTQFVKDGEYGLLNADIGSALSTFDGEVTIVNLSTAFRLNARLGNHICEAAMFEQAEGGKGRKIKLSFSDEFTTGHTTGKLKRCFFLVGALLAGGMDKTCMTLYFNQAARKLSLEYAPIASREEMQRFYALCLSVLGGMRNFDMNWTLGTNKVWGFESLETRLKQSQWDIDSFMDLLFSIDYADKPFYTRFNEVYKRLFELVNSITAVQPAKKDLLLDAYKTLSGKDQQREFKTFIKIMAMKWPEKIFPLLMPHSQLMALLNQDDIPIKYIGKTDNPQHVTSALSRGEANVFDHVSEKLMDNREFILAQVKQHPKAMKAHIQSWSRWHQDKNLMKEAFLHGACEWYHLDANWRNDKQFILSVIPSQKLWPYDLSDKLLEDRSVILTFLFHNQDLFGDTLQSFSDDPEVMLAAVKCCAGNLKRASDRLKNDRDFVLKAIRSQGSNLEYASHVLKYDIFGFEEDKSKDSNLEYASHALKDDIEVVQAACHLDGYALKYASDRLRGKKSVVLEAVSNRGSALQYASDKLKNDPDVFIAAIKQYHNAHIYAGSAWKQNREAVLAAVKAYGNNLREVDENFKNDAEIVSMAIQNTPYAFEHASDQFKQDKAFVMEAIRNYGSAVFMYVSNNLKRDSEVALAALRCWNGFNNFPMKYAHSDLRNNEGFITEAVKLSPNALAFASDELRNNSSFVKKLLHIDNRVLSYASDTLRTDKALMDYRDQVSILNT